MMLRSLTCGHGNKDLYSKCITNWDLIVRATIFQGTFYLHELRGLAEELSVIVLNASTEVPASHPISLKRVSL